MNIVVQSPYSTRTLAEIKDSCWPSPMPTAEFRFYEELNDHLPPARRKRAFVHTFDGTPRVREVIEALGVPHTEIDLILVDGRSVRFSHRLRGGERVAVYPMFERFDIRPLHRLRPRPLRRARFVVDVHLGRLARKLRLLGFDTVYSGDLDDATLVAISVRERRILLTRDVELLKHKAVTHGYRVRASDPDRQVEEVIRAFSLQKDLRPFTRCSECNSVLRVVPRAEVAGRVPPQVFRTFRRFTCCPGCGRLYWRGTHFRRLERWSRIVRTLFVTLLAAISIYVSLAAYLYFLQSRLIYFPNVPGRTLTATPGQLGLAFDELRIRAADGVELHGWYVPAGAGAPAVLLCHGNAGNISHRLQWLELFHDLGLSVLLFDYRGYGRSSGAPSERGTYLDAQAAWDYLTKRVGLAPGRIVVVGESLGGPIAAHLAKHVSPGAVILVSTFTAAPDLASEFYWYMPVHLLARIQYPTAAYVSQVRAPTLVIHSRSDEIVPFSHAEKIFQRARQPKQLLKITGGHNETFLRSGPELSKGIRVFLGRHGVLGPGDRAELQSSGAD